MAAVFGAPEGIELELLAVDGAVGHHLEPGPVVDHRLALQVFDHRRIAAGVGDGHVHGGLGLAAGAEGHRHDLDTVVLHGTHQILHRGVLAEQVEGPGGEGEAWAAGVGVADAEIVFRQVEEVGGQALFVHAIEHRIHRVARLGAAAQQHGAVAGAEAQGIHTTGTINHLPAGDHVEVGIEAVGPVHRTAGDHLLVGARPGDTGSGEGGAAEGGGGEGGQAQGGADDQGAAAAGKRRGGEGFSRIVARVTGSVPPAGEGPISRCAPTRSGHQGEFLAGLPGG
jgi:hypothetical protein